MFGAKMFTPTKLDTAQDKAKFANHFVKFVAGGFKRSDYPEWFYKRLSLVRGHIAHYDQWGFWDEWFSNPEKQKRFISYWIESDVYGDPAYTYSDVETALRNYLRNQLRNRPMASY